MSLRGKDFRCEIDGELHDKLRAMAGLKGVEVSTLGAEFLEKMIVAEFHVASVFAERVVRSGIVRKDAARQQPDLFKGEKK
jgi:hypothetical protein